MRRAAASALVLMAILAIGMPLAGGDALAQSDRATKGTKGTVAPNPEAEAAAARARSQKMQERQGQLDNDTLQSICSNCESGKAGKVSGKRKSKKKFRRRR